MPIEITHSESDAAITVPYPAFTSGNRTNRGFIDLRGRPDIAKNIAEAAKSKQLRALLVRLADKSAPIFSIGCDLGHHVETLAPKGLRSVAGGYVRVVSSLFDPVMPQHWASLCNSACELLSAEVGTDHWHTHFELEPVMMNLDGYGRFTGSVTINFYCSAKTHIAALRSRERLIAVLDRALSDAAVRRAFFDGKMPPKDSHVDE